MSTRLACLALLCLAGQLLFTCPVQAASTARALVWPVQGELRECPEFMDMALYPDSHAGNTVIIQSDVPGDVAGAVAYKPLPMPRNSEEQKAMVSAQGHGNGTAQRNTVIVQRGVVEGYVDGGWSGMGPARDNVLILSGGTVRKLARGGGSNGGPAEGNKLHMTAGQVDGSAYGGSSMHHTASGNSLTFSGGEVRDAVVGGSSSFGQAQANAVFMAGGRVTSVIGGSSGHSDAQGNRVYIHGGEVLGDIVGGETVDGEMVTQNTVHLRQGARLAPGVRIFGGLKTRPEEAAPTPQQAPQAEQAAQARDLFVLKGNVLMLAGWQGHVQGVHNFQYWNFALPDTLKAGDTLLTVHEPVDLRQCFADLLELPRVDLQPGQSLALLRAPALRTQDFTIVRPILKVEAQGRVKEYSLHLDNAQRPTALLLTRLRESESGKSKP